MKLIELFDNRLPEDVGSMIGGALKGANAFVSGASDGKYDASKITNFIDKDSDAYKNANKWLGFDKNKGTTRSVGKNLPPEERFRNLMVNIYGLDTINQHPEIVKSWDDVIRSNDVDSIKTLGQKLEKYERSTEQSGNGEWKKSNKQVIADLMKNASSGNLQKPDMEYFIKPKKKSEQPTDDESL